MIGVRMGFNFAQTEDTSVAKMAPTSAITERVKGIPMMANKMLKARPDIVTGAILPYPIQDRRIFTDKYIKSIFYRFGLSNDMIKDTPRYRQWSHTIISNRPHTA